MEAMTNKWLNQVIKQTTPDERFGYQWDAFPEQVETADIYRAWFSARYFVKKAEEELRERIKGDGLA